MNTRLPCHLASVLDFGKIIFKILEFGHDELRSAVHCVEEVPWLVYIFGEMSRLEYLHEHSPWARPLASLLGHGHDHNMHFGQEVVHSIRSFITTQVPNSSRGLAEENCSRSKW